MRKCLGSPGTISAESECMVPHLCAERSGVTLWRTEAQVKGEFTARAKRKPGGGGAAPQERKSPFVSPTSLSLFPAPFQVPLRERNVHSQTTKDPKQIFHSLRADSELSRGLYFTEKTSRHFLPPWKGRPLFPSVE